MGKQLATVTLPACGGCCGEPGLSWRCESLTGTASLCGISGYSSDESPYDPLAPQDWEGQFRKWGERALAGTLSRFGYQCSGCPGFPASGGASPAGSKQEFSGTYSVDCEGEQSFGVRIDTILNGDCVFESSLTPVDVTTVATGPSSEFADCSEPPAGGGSTVATTLTSRIVTGCGCGPSSTSFLNDVGTLTETLSEERSFYDALFEQDPDAIEGDSCCTQLTSANLLSPGSIAPHVMTGTAVRVRLQLFNGLSGSDYSVTITTSQENPQPEDPEDPPVPPTIKEYDFVIPGDTPLAYFQVPLAKPDDFPICVVSVVFNGEIIDV